MAESSNVPVVPKVPEHADFTLLVEDLVNYVIIQIDPFYIFEIDTLRYRDYIGKAFHLPIKYLFRSFDLRNDEDCIFFENHRNQIPSEETYVTFADSLELQYFAEGFDTRYLLLFCVRISKMAAIYYRHGIVDAPILAKLFIIDIMMEHHVTVDVWKSLHNNAREFGQHLAKDIWLSENIDSEAELIRAHYEVSGCESKVFYRSGKRNVLSENEENVQQKERACARDEIYEQKSAQYCSEGSSDTGVLQEHEPSSEYIPPKFNSDENKYINSVETSGSVKPRSSNVDQESVDTESICQRIKAMPTTALDE